MVFTLPFYYFIFIVLFFGRGVHVIHSFEMDQLLFKENGKSLAVMVICTVCLICTVRKSNCVKEVEKLKKNREERR